MRPEDIPEEVWRQSLTLVDAVIHQALDHNAPDSQEIIARAIIAAQEAQRERDAQVADETWGDGPSTCYDNGATSEGWNFACTAIAAAIRGGQQ